MSLDYYDKVPFATYSARSVLEYPDKEVELTVESYDYQKLG